MMKPLMANLAQGGKSKALQLMIPKFLQYTGLNSSGVLDTVKRDLADGNVLRAVNNLHLRQKPLNLSNIPGFQATHNYNRQATQFFDTILTRRLKTNNLVSNTYVGSLIQTLKQAVLGEHKHLIKDIHSLNNTALKTQAEVEELEWGHDDFLPIYGGLALLSVMLLVQFFLIHIFKTAVQNNVTRVLAKYASSIQPEEMIPLTPFHKGGGGPAPPYLQSV